MVLIDIPDAEPLRLEHLVLDLNGTLTNRGGLIPGVAERITELRARLGVHLATADTFGVAEELGRSLGVEMMRIGGGEDKATIVQGLGASVTAAIGNGTNDAPMLRAARLGIAVIGPEGASIAALTSADVACASILDALDLLADPTALVATLRP